MAKQLKNRTKKLRPTPSYIRELDREYRRRQRASRVAEEEYDQFLCECADVVREAIATLGSTFALGDLISKVEKLASDSWIEYSPYTQYQHAALCQACEKELESLVSAGGIRVERLYRRV